MPRKVAIVGLSGISMPEYFFDKTVDEVWTINNAHDHWGIKSDLIIAMDDFTRDEATHPDYVKTIAGAGIPVLSTEAKEKWPDVSPYPIKAVCDFLDKYVAEPCYLLDNTCNYALALALYQGWEEIHIFGVDWCHPYREADLQCSLVRFRDEGYSPTDWFKYYHPSLTVPRRNTEPGSEAFHFLLGLACALGIPPVLVNSTTLLNLDREKFFYGYQEQPNVT